MSIMLVAMANALLVPPWSVSLSVGAAPRIGLAGVGVRRDRLLANRLRTSAKRQKETFTDYHQALTRKGEADTTHTFWSRLRQPVERYNC